MDLRNLRSACNWLRTVLMAAIGACGAESWSVGVTASVIRYYEYSSIRLQTTILFSVVIISKLCEL